MDNNNLNQYDNRNGHNSGNNQNGRGPGGNGGPGGPNGQGKKPGLMFILMVALFTIMMISILLNMLGGGDENEITYTEFVQMVEDGKVESVEISADMSTLVIKTKSAQKENSPQLPDWYIYGNLLSNSAIISFFNPP